MLEEGKGDTGTEGKTCKFWGKVISRSGFWGGHQRDGRTKRLAEKKKKLLN